jgi:hypothetical protein
MTNDRPMLYALPVLAGVLTALLLVQGLVVGGSPVLTPVTYAVWSVLLLAAAAGRPYRRDLATLALVPAAAGLTAVTLVLGAVLFPGAAGWWAPAALLSGTPLTLAGLRSRSA